ncbi:MAG: hypothetical protein ACYDHD_10635 [Vulcanimicrobiaceae bacterium]
MYDDELDRAILALPLEEPPADLRDAILASTVYRPAFPFSPLEVSLLGACAGILVWLIALLVTTDVGPLFAQVGDAILSGAGVISHPMTLAWLALGIVVAAYLSVTMQPPIGPPRTVGR